MRQTLCFFLLLLFVPPVVAKDKSSMPKLIVNARYVLVTTYFGDNPANPRISPEDRQAVSDVEDAIRDWGRYVLAYERKTADIIVLIRKGRLVAAQAGIGIHAGSGRSSPSSGTVADIDAGDPQDMLSVYDAAQGVDSPPMWRDRMTDGLDSPRVRLLEEFRTKVEADAKNP